MGLSPSQGHNNLRLYHTTPYNHHSHRLDDTKHNLHFLHNLQNQFTKNRLSHPSTMRRRRNHSCCATCFRFSAERPRYLFGDERPYARSNLRVYHSERSLFRPNERHRRRQSFPLLSNLPFISRNASLVLVNHSPFALRDPRFGIFHHCSNSISYF